MRSSALRPRPLASAPARSTAWLVVTRIMQFDFIFDWARLARRRGRRPCGHHRLRHDRRVAGPRPKARRLLARIVIWDDRRLGRRKPLTAERATGANVNGAIDAILCARRHPDAAHRRNDRRASAPRDGRRTGTAGARHPPSGRALDLCRTPPPVRGPRDRIDGARPQDRRSRRHLVGQRQRVGSGAVRHGARGTDPRQYQSRPIARTNSNTRSGSRAAGR